MEGRERTRNRKSRNGWRGSFLKGGDFMEVLKERLCADSVDALNYSLIKKIMRRKKPIMSAYNRRRILENLMRCAERADIPEDFVVAVYFALCYST